MPSSWSRLISRVTLDRGGNATDFSAYRLSKITGSEWLKLASTNKLERDFILERIRCLGKALPDAFSDTIKKMRSQKLNHRILKILAKVLPERSKEVSQI